MSAARPAFYALAPGGWRDYVTLLHVPYTLWHLAYVVVGASLAPSLPLGRLAWALAAFFLALGVGAHALDELNGRPLRTRIPGRVLVAVAVASLGAAAAIGVAAAVTWNLWLLAFVAAGVFLAVAYTLELLGGRFHGDLWFPLAWGAFPVLAGYFAVAETIRAEAVLAAAFALALSHAQRVLSTQVRTVRRRVASVSGTVAYADGREERLGAGSLTGAPERALKALTAATVLLAAAVAVARHA